MNNLNVSYKDRPLRERTYVKGVKTFDQVTYDYVSEGRIFTFTGFGKNGKPPYKTPTAGEYTKSRTISPQGEYRYNEVWFSNTIDRFRDGNVSYNNGVDWTSFQSSYDGTVYNRAIDQFYENIRKSETNLALTIGEARETGRMLGVGKNLADIVSLARRAKRQALMNPSKTISQVWLSYKYGWQPLMSDIYGYLNWTYDLLNEGVPIVGRARRIENANVYTTYPDPLFAKPMGRRTQGKREWRCEVKVWAGVSDSTWYNISRITSLNPLSIAWELVPLSFVVDWFYDVGGYLQNMEASLGTGLAFKRGYVTEVYYHDMKQTHTQDMYVYYAHSLDYKRQYFNMTGSQVYAKKRRVKLTTFPRPLLPTFNTKLGAQRIMSAAALLRTILLGGVSGRRF